MPMRRVFLLLTLQDAGIGAVLDVGEFFFGESAQVNLKVIFPQEAIHTSRFDIGTVQNESSQLVELSRLGGKQSDEIICQPCVLTTFFVPAITPNFEPLICNDQ